MIQLALIIGFREKFRFTSLKNQTNFLFLSIYLILLYKSLQNYLYPSGNTDPDPDPIGEISIDGPDKAKKNEKKWFSIKNHSGSGDWWYKESRKSWIQVGSYSTIWIKLRKSYTVAVGVNGTYYYKDVTVK